MSEEGAALPREERSIAGPLASCLALVILLAAAIGGGALALQGDPAPTLSETKGVWTLSRSGQGSIQVLLGPGCSDLRLSEIEVGSFSLAWLCEGQPLSADVNWTGQGLFVGDELVPPGQSVLLLPNEEAHLVDPTSNPLLKLERWEGGLSETEGCVIWLYEGTGPVFLTHLLGDGHDFRQSRSSGRSLGSKGYSFYEHYPNATRLGEFPGGQDPATYTLTVGGKVQEAILERTYQGTWNSGDPPPQARGY